MERERRVTPKNKKNKETPLQQQAREYYYALGNGRSQLLVAQHFKKSIQTIGLWSSKYKWVEYAKGQDATTFKKETTLLIKEFKKGKDDLKGVVSGLVAKFKKNFEEQKIICTNIQDLERVTKLFLLLEGEATEREERKVIFEDVSTKEDLKKSLANATEGFKLLDFKENKVE